MTTLVKPPLSTTASTQEAPVKQKGVLHYIGTGLSFGLLALVMLVAMLVIALPMATKSTPYTVLTSSMTPSYPAGTLVVVKPTPVEDIHLGDVVTYQIRSGQPEVVTHRVTSVILPSKPGDEVGFITKGDANSLPDAPVKAVQVRGVVWYAVPYIGWVNNVINGNSRNVIIPIAAGVLFLYAGFMIAGTVVDRRRKATLAARATRQAAIDAELRELVEAGRR